MGFDGLTKMLVHLCNQQVGKQESKRTFKDGICLAGILLLEKHHGMVQGLMRGKKDRAKSDASEDPTLAAFEDIAKEFNDPEVFIHSPADEHLHKLDDWETLDPNDVSVHC